MPPKRIDLNTSEPPEDSPAWPYARRRRRLRWPLLVALAAVHVAALYWLAYALAPDLATSVEREVIAAFEVAPAPSPPPPQNRSEPDEGAEAPPAEKAVAAPVTAPEEKLPVATAQKRPEAASTGAAAQSGARDKGEGTGAAGAGTGTGSGNQGRGGGGVAVTRPVHISGAIDNARDYPTPPGGRAVRRGSEVVVRVIVGTDGRARDCTIYRPSLDPKADAITCQLVVDQLGFRPARDANGNPVAAPFYWRQRWF